MSVVNNFYLYVLQMLDSPGKLSNYGHISHRPFHEKICFVLFSMTMQHAVNVSMTMAQTALKEIHDSSLCGFSFLHSTSKYVQKCVCRLLYGQERQFVRIEQHTREAPLLSTLHQLIYHIKALHGIHK